MSRQEKIKRTEGKLTDLEVNRALHLAGIPWHTHTDWKDIGQIYDANRDTSVTVNLSGKRVIVSDILHHYNILDINRERLNEIYDYDMLEHGLVKTKTDQQKIVEEDEDVKS